MMFVASREWWRTIRARPSNAFNATPGLLTRPENPQTNDKCSSSDNLVAEKWCP